MADRRRALYGPATGAGSAGAARSVSGSGSRSCRPAQSVAGVVQNWRNPECDRGETQTCATTGLAIVTATPGPPFSFASACVQLVPRRCRHFTQIPMQPGRGALGSSR